MAQFLGGIQLADNISILSYKNENGHWLSLYKYDKFINFVTYGSEFHMLTASPCGYFFAYYQSNPHEQTLDFDVWEYDPTDQLIQQYTAIKTPLDKALPLHMTQLCFNYKSTHVIGLSEWNRAHLINLTQLDAHTEFNIPTEYSLLRQQKIFTGSENYFAWFGQDEYLRIIDLNTEPSTMWHEKIITSKIKKDNLVYIKYFFEFNGYIVFMFLNGSIMMCKPDLQNKCIRIDYDVKCPVRNCTDITIIDNKTICFETNNDKQKFEYLTLEFC